MPESQANSSTDAPATYTVLARRYRSTTFDEVVGQEGIARTLKNAIARNRTAHAYLFTGTRGVGKTSMARIFAKAMNAIVGLAEQEAIALAILKGEDIDVIEIDGASNRGIDQVRDLIANSGLSPARCPHKIYIIDEVHMLTKESFNALLKVMEEPPSHVKFILCTTEPHKVPATIQSRCQRFDFHNIAVSRIAQHLTAVLVNEGIEAEPAVVNELARLGNGSMRDALSLLDRLIASSDGGLTLDTLQDTMGTPDHALVAEVVERIAAAEAGAALEAANRLLMRGVSIERGLQVLIDHFRQVMIVAACGAESELFELYGDARDLAVAHADQFDVTSLTYIIALLEATADRLKRSATGRALFDAVLVRLCMTEHLAHSAALLGGAAPVATRKAATEKKKPVAQSPLPPPPERSPATTPPVATETPAVAVEPKLDPSQVAELKTNPLVSKAMELFDGRIVGVKSTTTGHELKGKEDA